MASTAVGVPQTQQSAELPKKRMRLNPARRKAAKAKAEAETQKNSSEAANVPVNQQASLQPQNAAATPSQTNVAKLKPAAPTPLQRQNTEPTGVNQKQIVATRSPGVKPVLNRTVTAPPSTDAPKSTLALTAPALVTGGLVGCAAGAAILLGVGIWYDFSGAEQAILAARAAKLCVDNLAEEIIASLKVGTYSADEALDMLRRTTLAYASTIPEGAPFVERVFREIDTVRKQRGREIDKVVAETYGELQKAGRRGASSAEMRSIVVGQLMKLSSFASRATQDIVARNPSLKPYRDGASKALQGPPESKLPTVRLNMAVRQKQGTIG